MKKRILLVEDEAGLIMTISDRFISKGYALDSASNLTDAQSLLKANYYDLLVLDVMLPDGDGLEFCAGLRAKKYTNPIILLTAKATVGDRVRGLQNGADDYLCKPFSMSELLARIEALLRRSGTLSLSRSNETHSGTEQATIQFGLWHLDTRSRALTRNDFSTKPAQLSTTEFRLLYYLFTHQNEVLSREELLDAVWGYNNEVGSRTVDVHIAWLRQKLCEKDSPVHIHTIRRAGYRFVI